MRLLQGFRQSKQAVPPSTVAVLLPDTIESMIVEDGVYVIGPKDAAKILEDANFKGQRKRYNHHIDLLAYAMRRGQFSEKTQLVFVKLNGKLHLVNGQHRLAAVMISGRDVLFTCTILDRATEEELRAEYYRHDRAQRHRSTSEVLNAVSATETYEISKTMATAVFNAAALLANDLVEPNYLRQPVEARSDDHKLGVAKEWWPYAKKFQECLDAVARDDAGKKIPGIPKNIKAKLYTNGFTAVALATLRDQEEKATEFWTGLAQDDGLRQGDARKTLLNDMTTRTLNTGGKKQSVIAPALAWNAFFEGRTLKIIKVTAASTPTLSGTRYGAKRRG